MELTFLGASREVGRSSILVEGRERVMLDCGIKPAKEPEYPLIEPKTAKSLNHVILSHAHLDHSGYLPALYSMGYKGKVMMTKPTRDLIQLLLADFLRLSSNNKKAGKTTAAAPYTQNDVDKLLKSTEILEFDELTKPASPRGYAFRLRPAGHIMGAAMVEVHAERKILYTGDVDLRESRLIDGCTTKGLEADVMIMESTYGARADRHQSMKQTGKDFVDSINKTLKGGGKVIIPTFAIGRGQEILFTLESYMRSGALEPAPIYLDGMVTRALRIYRHNAIFLKKEIQRRILTSEDDPFKSEFYNIPQRKDRSDVIEQEKAIILATSGMLNGGPVLRYIDALGPDPKNKIILVGYQVEGTRGRDLIDGKPIVDDEGKVYDVRCPVEQAPFSGHADHDALVTLAKSVRGLKTVFVIHGEGAKSYELAEDIQSQCKGVQTVIPELGETVTI